MEPRTFISCSPSEDGRSAQLAQLLESRGCTVWRHCERARSAAYRAETARAIDEAQIVIVLWSRASLASPWVIDEADAGMKKGAAVSVEVGQTSGLMGFAGAARVRVAKSSSELSRQDEANIWEAVLDVADAAGLLGRRRIWLDRSPRSALANCCFNWLLFGALALAANLAYWPPFLSGFRGLWTALTVGISTLIVGYAADAFAQRRGTRARAYRRRLAFRWLAESIGGGTGAFLQYLRWSWESPKRDSSWLSEVPVMGAFSLVWAVLLAVKFLPLLTSERVQRFLLGRPRDLC